MILNVDHRKRFNDLIERLRNDDVLNTQNLEKVLKYRCYKSKIACFFLITICIPLSIFSCFLVYQLFQDVSHEHVTENIVMLLCCLPMIVLCFYVFKENADKEFKYVFLMTDGERTDGTILFYSHEPMKGRRWASYTFFDHSGVQHQGDMKISHNFDITFDYKPGEAVDIVFDPKNPKSNMIMSYEMRMFDLGREKELTPFMIRKIEHITSG